MGWVRTFRNNQFIALNDGSPMKICRLFLNWENMKIPVEKITTGASLKVTGTIVAFIGQRTESRIENNNIEIFGDSDPEKFPLQPKKHSLEFLREIAHLRFRTNTFGSVFRVRHALAFAVHKFFNDKRICLPAYSHNHGIRC